MMDFSEKLLTLRKTKGLTQEQLAEMLEKQQKEMLVREQKMRAVFGCGMYAAAIYLIFIAVYAVGHFYFEVWNPSIVFAEFLVATAIVIIVCVKKLSKRL